MKPLFIPLNTEYYRAFERGEKTTEYRLYGPRWNEKTCTLGRRVTLSLGYGKKNRLYGTVTAFAVDQSPAKRPGWTACYGPSNGFAACITIQLDARPSCPPKL